MLAQHQASYLPLRRVTRREPCPICGHIKGCEIRADGAVNCIQVQSPYPSGRLGGHWHRLPERDTGGRVHWRPEDLAAPPTRETPAKSAAAESVDAATCAAVYSALLAACPLSAAHRAHLGGPTRGLPDAALGDYGTVPARKDQARALAPLLERFGRAVLLGVPGFIADGESGVRLALSGGLLIPYRDATGRIRACQVRGDDGVYRWLSSTSAGGPSSGAPAHVARPHGPVRYHAVVLTEGGLKAAIAAELIGATTIGVAGHAAWKAALEPLDALQGAGADVAIIALDADDPTAKAATVHQVEANGQALAAALAARGWAVRFARWPHAAGKGIDDLLLAGGTYALEIYRPELAPLGGPSDDDPGAPDVPDTTPLGYKMRVLTSLIKNPAKVSLRKTKGERTVHHLTPAEVGVLQAAYVKAGAWPLPATTPAPQNPPLRAYPVPFLASAAGVTPNKAGQALDRLDTLGLLTVQRRSVLDPETDNWKTVTLIGPGRELGWNEELPADERRAADAARRRCPSCGGIRLLERTLVCKDCGSVCTVAEAEQAAADAARDDATERFTESVDGSCDGDDGPREAWQEAHVESVPAPLSSPEILSEEQGIAMDSVNRSAEAVPRVQIVAQDPDEDAMVAWERAQRRRHLEIGARISDAGRSPQHRPASPGPAPSVEWPRSTEGWPVAAAGGAGP